MRAAKSLIFLILLNILVWAISPLPSLLRTSGQEIAPPLRQSLPSSGLAWSPDGTRLAAIGGPDDNAILLWDADQKLINTLKGHEGWISGIAWSPDGKLLASAGRDKVIHLWNSDGNLLQTISGHTGAITSLMWSPDSTLLASAASNDDGTIRLWTPDGQAVRTLTGGPTHIDGGTRVIWSPTGKMLVALYGDNKAQVWDTDGNVLTNLVDNHDGLETGNINRIIWSPDGQTIAAATVNKGIQIFKWDGTLIRSFLTDASNMEVVWSPDGKVIAASAFNKQFWLWNADTGQEIAKFDNSGSYIPAITFSPDGSLVAFASTDKENTVYIWDMQGQQVAVMSANQQVKGTVQLAWSPDSKILVGMLGNNAPLTLWDRAGKNIGMLSDPLMPPPQAPSAAFAPNPDGHTDLVTGAAWSYDPTGPKLATFGLDRTVRIWNTEGKLAAKISEPKPDYAVAWSLDGKTLATGGQDRLLRLYSADGNLIQTFATPAAGDFIMDIKWLNDGKTIATTANTNTIQLWDTTTGMLKTQYRVASTLLNPTWSPDNSHLAYIDDAQGILVVADTEGKIVTQFANLTLNVTSLAWSPDGKKLALTSSDRTDLYGFDGKLVGSVSNAVATVSPTDQPMFHFTYLAWSPDSTRLAIGWIDQPPMNPSTGSSGSSTDSSTSATSNKQPELPSLASHIILVDGNGNEIISFSPGPTKQDMSMVWSSDGKLLAVHTRENGLQIFDVDGKPQAALVPPAGTKIMVDGTKPIAWSPDSKLLATSSETVGVIQLWRSDGQLITTLKVPTGIGGVMFPGVLWSPDSRYIAARYGDGATALLWDTSGKMIANLVGQ